jgi:amidase
MVTIASGATWQEVAAGMQRHRDETIMAVRPPLPSNLKHLTLPLDLTGIPNQILSPQEIEITHLKVEDLAALLAKSELSAIDVITAYLRSAGLAQKLVSSRIFWFIRNCN